MLADVPGVARRYFQKIELEKKKINFRKKIVLFFPFVSPRLPMCPLKTFQRIRSSRLASFSYHINMAIGGFHIGDLFMINN